MALVRHLDETAAIPCPYGEVRRVVTGGEGGVANVHHVTVTAGGRHWHEGYNETYYIMSGNGRIVFDDRSETVRAGSVVVIPAGEPHAVETDGDPLEFVIFGTPAMPVEDPRFTPRS